MASRRYTILIADRGTGAMRRMTVSLRPAATLVLSILAVPVLLGLGVRWSALSEIEQLRTANATLHIENSSYRAATGELTAQIASLQTAIVDLGERSELDPATQQAIEKLPSVVRARAMGGTEHPPSSALLAATFTSPDGAFGILRDLLGILEDRLQLVRLGVERRRALAAATPSMWPAHGWLSGTFGNRRDPFTGEMSFHPALDISTERGSPIYATADGIIRLASYSGAYGNLIELDHGFGLLTRYAHLQRFAVKPGDRVERGSLIGYVGATGRATGTHVHYEIWANGRPINPLSLLTSSPSAPLAAQR